MVDISQKYLDELPKRVDEVESYYRYFKENNLSYTESRKFIFDTTITEELRSTLININWPIFEVNTLESFISRLAGEFAKQIPDPSVMSTGISKDDPKISKLIDFLEGRLRYVFGSAETDNIEKAIFMESISGGFSVGELCIDYINPFSFEQDVRFEKSRDPTKCYFDTRAKKNHKGDGDYCGKLVPMLEEDFIAEFPHVDIKDIQWGSDELTAGNLHWYYTDGEDSNLRKVIYVADHYVKKQKKVQLVQIKLPNLKPLIKKILATTQQYLLMKQQQTQQMQQMPSQTSQNPVGTNAPMPAPTPIPKPSMLPLQSPLQSPEDKKEQPFILKTLTEEEYEIFSEMWKEHTMLPAPKILRRRTTMIDEIWNYRFTKGKLLRKPKKTIFPILPLIFFDGNSHVVEDKQKTRPYHYQAKDAQKMKNVVGIAMMNAIENFPQVRLAMAKETIPEEPAYKDTLRNPQKPAAAIIYNGMGQTNDDRPLNPPMPLNFQYFSGELIQLYSELDKTIQMILGNFDQQLGLSQKDLSGIAMQEAITQSNNAAMPYINNYIDSMNQVAKGMVEVWPKLMKTPRSVPIINKDGLHEAILINDPLSDILHMDYNAMDIEVVIKFSVNFQIQKDRTFENLTKLLVLPDPNPFKGFFGGPAATDLLDNMTVRNQDMLKEKFIEYQDMQQQQQAEAKKMAMMTNPTVAKLFETQMTTQLKQQELKMEEVSQKMNQQIEGMKMLQTFIESIAKIRESADQLAIQKSQIDAENRRTASESATNALEAAISVDRHLGEQFDRQAEHMYRQVELGDQLNETQIKREAISQKNNGSAGDERQQD